MDEDYFKLKIKIELKLRELIKQKCKTIEKFSEEFGCDIRTASRWINNGVDSIWKLCEICNFFGVKIENLLGGNENETM